MSMTTSQYSSDADNDQNLFAEHPMGIYSQEENLYQHQHQIYRPLQQLSSTQLSKVYLCKNSNEKLVVLKVASYVNYQQDTIEWDPKLVEESNRLHTQHLLYILDVFTIEKNTDEKYLCVVSEYCENGSCATSIDTLRKSMNVSLFLQILFQMLRALEALHLGLFVHADVKLDNIFVRKFDRNRVYVVLGDLGLSSKMFFDGEEISQSYLDNELTTVTTGKIGTFSYRDPTIMKRGKVYFKSDIWSLEEFPNFESTKTEQRLKIIQHIFSHFENDKKEWELCQNIIERMLVEDVKERATISDIRSMIYSTTIDDSSFENNYQHFREEFKCNRSVIISCLSAKGSNLQHVPDAFHNNNKIVMEAINNDPRAYQYIKGNLKNQSYIVNAVVERDPSVQVPVHLATTPSHYVAANSIEMELSEQEKNDKRLVMEILEIDGTRLKDASWELKNDRDCVAKSVKQRGISLQFASDDLRNDEEIVTIALSQNGMALEYADPSLRQREDIVMKAVSQNGLALQFASTELRNNPRVVERAVLSEYTGKVLFLIGEELMCNVSFMVRLLCVNQLLFQYLYTFGEESFRNLCYEYQHDDQYIWCLNGLYSIFEDNINEAMKYLQLAAEQDNTSAQFLLGTIYQKGELLEQDFRQAFECFDKSAEKGYPEAQFSIGLMYYHGEHVSQDKESAFYWIYRAAEQGHMKAESSIGSLCYEQEEYSKSFEWYLKAAEKGDIDAQFEIGSIYQHGVGISTHHISAFNWYLKAAERGHSKAQNNLSLLYQTGQGIPQNYSKALEWFMKSAENNDTTAMNYIGLIYQNGQGVTKDNTKAFQWFLKAAEFGNAQSQLLVANMYQLGIGVEQNLNKAMEWYQIAAGFQIFSNNSQQDEN